MLYKWDETSTLNFLNEYKKHPCLWNPADKNYQKEKKKLVALKVIIKQLKLNRLTVDACLKQIDHIRKIYIEEQKKEIRHLRCNKLFESEVPWYDLFKGMVHEIIEKPSPKNNIVTKICVTPEDYEILCLSKKKVVCKKPFQKELKNKKNNKEKKKDQTRRDYKITPIYRKTRPVGSDTEQSCCYVVKDLNECPSEKGNCLGESSSDSHLETGKFCKVDRICKSSSTTDLGRKCSRKYSNLKMQPSKQSYNFKRNLETSPPSLSSKTYNSYCQFKSSTVGTDCDKYLSDKYKSCQEPPKKLSFDFAPCPAYSKYNSGIHGNVNSGAKYDHYPGYSKSYDKDFPSKQYSERDSNLYSCLDKYKYANFEENNSLQYKTNFETYETPSKFGTKCPGENCEYKILETTSPVKIIIMDNKRNSGCPAVQCESKGQNKLTCTNNIVFCNKEIQCCASAAPISKGQQCCVDVGIECDAKEVRTPSVSVTSFAVRNCPNVKENDFKCCGNCNFDNENDDSTLHNLTIKLMLECIEKILKSQGKEVPQNCSSVETINNSTSGYEPTSNLTKNCCTNTSITEEQCNAVMKKKSNCCIEQYLSKIEKDNSELKEAVGAIKEFIQMQSESADKKDRNRNEPNEYPSAWTDNCYNLSTQTSMNCLPLKESKFRDTCSPAKSDKSVTKIMSTKSFAYQETPAVKDNITQTDKVKSNHSHKIYNFAPDLDCFETCPGIQDRTRVKPEFLSLFQTRIGVDENLLKKFKVDDKKSHSSRRK